MYYYIGMSVNLVNAKKDTLIKYFEFGFVEVYPAIIVPMVVTP